MVGTPTDDTIWYLGYYSPNGTMVYVGGAQGDDLQSTVEEIA